MSELREYIKLLNTAISETTNLYRLWGKKNGLTYNALTVLYVLNDTGPSTQKELSEWWAIPKQTVQSIVENFFKSGYVEKETNDDDHRTVKIKLTEKGIKYAETILTPLYRMEEQAMMQLTEEQRQQFILLNQMYFHYMKKEIDNG